VTKQDFEKVFNSHKKYGGRNMDGDLWEELLKETGKDGDGVITFDDFENTMNMVRKSWLRRCDRSPSKSPRKKFDQSPVKKF
jgi:hypothetical protein